MYSVTSAFKTKADDPQDIEVRKFTFKGIDYTDKLLRMGGWNQSQYEDDEPQSVDLTVELLNDSKEFNFIQTTKTNMGKVGKLEIGFDSELIERYTGYLDRVEFASRERPVAILTFVSKLQQAINRRVGSTATAVSYAAQNPADLAWSVLTVYGGMDTTKTGANANVLFSFGDVVKTESSTENTTVLSFGGVHGSVALDGNTDIDYKSWKTWKDQCDDLSLSIAANFAGQTVAGAMRLIGDVVDTLIFAETTGKVFFRKFVLKESGTPYLFDDQKAHFRDISMRMNKTRTRIVNKVIVNYGYSTASNTFSGALTFTNTTSQTDYGLFEREFDNKNVWHDSALSAKSFGERLVSRYKEPVDTVTFKTKRGTQAMIHQIGDVMKVNWDQMDYSNKEMRIYGISSSLSEGEYEITSEDVSALASISLFVLDDTTNGQLDVSKLN